jgi:hypothetical protein
VLYLETQLPLWPDSTEAVLLDEAEFVGGSRWRWQSSKAKRRRSRQSGIQKARNLKLFKKYLAKKEDPEENKKKIL